jgi:hypothetical protein
MPENEQKVQAVANNAYLILISRLAAPLVAALAAFIWFSFMQDYERHKIEAEKRWELLSLSQQQHELRLKVIEVTRFTEDEADARETRLEVRFGQQMASLREALDLIRKDLHHIRTAVGEIQRPRATPTQ